MTRKKVWRFYCDHCRKGGCGGGAIAKHERGCVRNPNRICGMCRIAEFEQQSLAELITVYKRVGLAALRNKSYGCPACMLAAIVQSGMVREAEEPFDYKQERETFWQQLNDDLCEREALARKVM